MPLRTPLYETHAAAGATFTDFAGFDMPVHYGSIRKEHMAVRQRAGLFDVSHMSNLWIEGPGAADTIGAVTPKDAGTQKVGRGWYTVVLREDGTILDDTFCFRIEEERLLMIPNAGMGQAVRQHLEAHGSGEATVTDESRDWAILALQGPEAQGIFEEVGQSPPKRNRIDAVDVAGHEALASGTGYTGEKGLELYLPARTAPAVWAALLEAGGERLQPVGLGARDTLRLEKGFCLAGNEFAGGRTPLEADLGWLLDWDHDFLGKHALEVQRGSDHEVLSGLVMEKGIPRQGHEVRKAGEKVGEVTSGTQSPSLRKGIALGYLRGVDEGDEVEVDVRGRPRAATVTKPPFV